MEQERVLGHLGFVFCCLLLTFWLVCEGLQVEVGKRKKNQNQEMTCEH